MSTSTKPLRYLLFALDGDGSNPPFIAVAQQLHSAGHHITFAGYSSQQKMVEASGFTFVLLAQSSKKQALHSNHAITAQTLAMMANDDHFTEVPSIIADVHPDRIVIDCMMLSGQVALQREAAKGTALPPVTLLFHSTTSGMGCLDLIPLPFINQLRGMAGLPPLDVYNTGVLHDMINILRQQYDLAPITSLFDQWASILQQLPGSRALLATVPELETAEYADMVKAMPEGSFVYIGAQIPRADRPIHVEASLKAPSTATTAAAWSASLPFDVNESSTSSTPLIVASFNSGRTFPQVSHINRVGAALGGTQTRPYKLLVTYAAQQLDELHVPSNVGLTSYIPHSLVLPLSSACITHCGHGTLTAALSHGIPVVCLPNMGDQVILSGRVQELGAGVVLDGEKATPDEIRAAVDRVLDEPSFKAKAMELKAKYDALKARYSPLVV